MSSTVVDPKLAALIDFYPAECRCKERKLDLLVPRLVERVIMVKERCGQIFRDETGAATAEYAIATMAAVGFAGLLVVIMRSDEVRGMLTELVRNALTFSG